MVQFKVEADGVTDEELERAFESVAEHNLEITTEGTELTVHGHSVSVDANGSVSLILAEQDSFNVKEATELTSALEQLERGLQAHSELENVTASVE